jgi:hypothetical protein
MTPDREAALSRSYWRTVLGVVVTSAWVVGSGVLACTKWKSLSTMTPNAWGDFLAGLFAPPAFLWLILGYFQQSEELRLNTHALFLQQRELEHQVAETAELARNAGRQASATERTLQLYEDERQAALKRERDNAQPKLRRETVSVVGTGAAEMQLKNKGAFASQLSIVFEGSLNGSISPTDLLEPNGILHLRLEPCATPQTFVIHYHDAHGQPGAVRFLYHGRGVLAEAPTDAAVSEA